MFPTKIYDQIAYVGGMDVLRKISTKVSKHTRKRVIANEPYTLVYGNVQGGKTKEIIKIIKDPLYDGEKKVVVIQNSLMALNQYAERLKNEKIKYVIVNDETNYEDADVILIMNNKNRYKHFRIKDNDYILILDESDLTVKTCPLKGYKNYHVTATPFTHKKIYNDIITIDINENYKNIESLIIRVEIDESKVIREMLLRKTSSMLLINKYKKKTEMRECSEVLSTQFKNIPIVNLSGNTIYYEGKKIRIKSGLTKIIDMYKNEKIIVFVANRHSLRGLSYTSSDYKRHLTDQITTVRKNASNFLQSLRILGIYLDNSELKLYIDDEKIYEKNMKLYNNFLLNRLIM